MTRSAELQRGQWSLVGTLVAIAILITLAALYLPKIAARHSAPGQVATPRERAYGAGCAEYASQMNQAVALYKQDNDDKPPTSLNDLIKYGITNEILNAEGCSFQMDPASGKVVDTGHGRALPNTAVPGMPAPATPQTARPNTMPNTPGGIHIPVIPDSGSAAPGDSGN